MNIDGFVILTPLLMLPVIALLGFVGCGTVWGLDEVADPPAPGPSDVSATGFDGYVEITWSLYPNASQYTIWRRTETEPRQIIFFALPGDTSYIDSDNIMNGTQYCYEVTATVGNQTSQPVAEDCEIRCECRLCLDGMMGLWVQRIVDRTASALTED